MLVFSHGLVLFSLLSITAFAHSITRTTANVARRNSNAVKSHFVSQQGSNLMVNGSRFTYIGTTAYWLSSLNTDEDIDHTLGNISQAGFNAVRTWAFNDVEQIPENGTWFQLIQNGTLTINNGTNGLQKLDKVMNFAQKHGLYVLLSLTNNWNPQPSDVINITDPLTVFRFGRRDTLLGINDTRPRNTLSNDYGGMDAYVRNFGGPLEHDQFYTNMTLINAFKNYTEQIVTRFRDHPNVLSWELANDPRCNSSVSGSSGCVTQNITRWHSELAQHVRGIDPNHLVSSGTQGFRCLDCEKLFPVPQALPQPSPVPGVRRNTATLLTKERILRERKEAFKKTRATAKRSLEEGIRIRGRWISTPTRRQQDQGQDSTLDGSFGVDSDDILGISDIGFSSFQLFPDQNSYGPDDPNLSPFNNTLTQGLEWIRQHANVGRVYGKPVTMSSVGLVTQQNAQDFVPFNTTIAPFANDMTSVPPDQQPFATDTQASDALSQWMNSAVDQGIQGMIHYQWTQPGLTVASGSVIDSPTSPVGDQTPTSPVDTQTGTSPNDGYATDDTGSLSSLVHSIQQRFSPDSNARR